MDLNVIKKRLNQLQKSNTRTSNLWKPQPGPQVVRIVPYKYNSDNPFIELYFHYGLADKNGEFFKYDQCKSYNSNVYSNYNTNTIRNKLHKWQLRLHHRIKCRKSPSGNTNDVKSFKVFEICRNNVKVNGKNRVNCSYANNDIWNKTYIGRMQVKLNDGNKTKTLYFPVK